eukprot:365339-Chlamydomonas_euryale.AAC.9
MQAGWPGPHGGRPAPRQRGRRRRKQRCAARRAASGSCGAREAVEPRRRCTSGEDVLELCTGGGVASALVGLRSPFAPCGRQQGRGSVTAARKELQPVVCPCSLRA